MFLATLLISIFCFSSCSKDDEAIEVNQLEGVWGMTAVNGYYYYEGEKISYNENFNPFEPTDDCEKITIEKTDGNKLNPEKPDVPLNKNDAFQKVQKRRVQEKR